MIMTFSQLDDYCKDFITHAISIVLDSHADCRIDSSELLEIFSRFDVDVLVSEDQTMTIQNNEKLKSAVRCITGNA